jgi:uncharacterized RDD family membrane protein YckC
MNKMPATFLQRLLAFLLDYMWIVTYLALLVVMSTLVYPPIQQIFTYSLWLSQLFGFLLVTLPVSLYYIIMDSKIGRQSFGKKKIGIRVVNRSGQPLTLGHSTLRTILKFIPWELSHFLVYRFASLGNQEVPFVYYLIGGIVYGLLFAYILTALFTRTKRSLYDMMARTEVVKVNG